MSEIQVQAKVPKTHSTKKQESYQSESSKSSRPGANQFSIS